MSVMREKHEVRRYDKGGDKKGTVVAGGHGKGEGRHQLNCPHSSLRRWSVDSLRIGH